MDKKLKILLLIWILSALNINATISGSCGDNVNYTLDTSTGVLKISGTGAMKNYTVNNGTYPWFGSRGYIKSIEITNGVTSIGIKAFEWCDNLTSVTIPNSVTSIGENAFIGCYNLTFIDIPSSIESIGYDAFKYCSVITSVDIKDIEAWCGIKFSSPCSNPLYYAHNIFMNGKKIKDLTIPDGVTSIGNYAFCSCSGLTSIIIPNSVTSIGENAFSSCSGLTSLDIPNSVTSIGSSAFSGCSGLTSVTIPNSVTSIGGYAFSGCSGLNSVIIGSSVKSIGGYLFYSNKPAKVIWLTNTPPKNYTSAQGTVNYVANNNYIDLSNVTVYPFLSSMFDVDGIRYVPVSPSERTCDAIDCVYNESAEKITISETVTNKGIILTVKQVCPYTCYQNGYIKELNVNSNFKGDIVEKTFYGCVGLKKATIFNQGDISTSAFEGCTGITSATISNQGNVGERAFYGCATKGPATFIINNNGNIGSSAFEGCTGITSATISNQGDIGQKSFYGCATSGDATFIIENAGNISASAFEGCTSITSATINNQGNIGQKSFYGCSTSNLATLIINNSGYIGTSAFEGCTGITSATISNQGNVGERAFYGCATNNPATFVINNKGTILKSAFKGCTQITTAELGEEIPSIADSTFYGCSKLSDIIIPDAVTSIGTCSFSNCSSLNFAKIGIGIKTIPSYTFSGCSSLKDVQIGKNVTSIGEYVFSGCSALPKIQIPQSVTSIANYVFKECSGLKTVIMDNGDSELSLSSNGASPLFASCPLDSVYIGRNITYTTSSDKGYSPFYRNTSLRTVVITDKETEISDNEFYGCSNLQNFKVGDGVTSFGKYAFSGCSSLMSLSFGTKLQSIGQETFSDCTAVTAITSKAQTPPTCGSQALDDINKWECMLYVPEGHIADYQAADQWKEFFFVEEGEENEGSEEGGDTPIDPTDNRCATPNISFVDGKLSFSCETEGVEYVYSVIPPSAISGKGNDINLSTTYRIIVYATKEGYLSSEIATKDIDVHGFGGIRGDLNGDGVVNMPDAMFIVNKILKDKFPDE